MRKLFFLLSIIFFPFLSKSQASNQNKINWISLKKAQEYSKKYDQNILVYFYKNQQAYCALLSDSDYKVEKFNISNHDAACSSIFNFTDEVTKSKVWANRKHRMLKTINLKTLKFDTLIKRNDINSYYCLKFY